MDLPGSGHFVGIDPQSGKIVWERKEKGNALLGDATGEYLLVTREKELLVLDRASGREVFRTIVAFKNDVEAVQPAGDSRAIVRAGGEIVAFDLPAGKKVFQESIRSPRYARLEQESLIAALITVPVLFGPIVATFYGYGRLALLAQVFAGGAILQTAERAWWPLATLARRNATAEYSYFATGVGSENFETVQLVNATGDHRVIGPFAPRRLANLVDEMHGFLYVLDDRSISAYPFPISPDNHERIHLLAFDALARERLLRAKTWKESGDTQKALRLVREHLQNPLPQEPERLALLAHWHAAQTQEMLSSLEEGSTPVPSIQKAIEHYRAAAALAGKLGDDAVAAGIGRDAAGRVAKLTAP